MRWTLAKLLGFDSRQGRTSDRRTPKPSAPLLGLLLLLALVPPLLAQTAGETVGSFAMFSAVDRYRLELAVRSPGGVREVPLRRLAPHLSRDAKRIILPAAGGSFGRDQANIL